MTTFLKILPARKGWALVIPDEDSCVPAPKYVSIVGFGVGADGRSVPLTAAGPVDLSEPVLVRTPEGPMELPAGIMIEWGQERSWLQRKWSWKQARLRAAAGMQ